jgi:hypothetical protein
MNPLHSVFVKIRKFLLLLCRHFSKLYVSSLLVMDGGYSYLPLT